MPPEFRWLFALSLPFLAPDDPPGGGGSGTTTDPEPKDPPKQDDDDRDDHDDKLGDPGKKALDAEREARRVAEKQLRDTTKELADLKKAQQDREEAEAKEKGEWEKLAKDRADKIAELEAQLAERQTTDLKASIARKHSIPDDLIPLLQGESEDDIEASAKTLAKHVKQREAPDTDAGERTPAGAKKKAGEKNKANYADPAYWGLPRS